MQVRLLPPDLGGGHLTGHDVDDEIGLGDAVGQLVPQAAEPPAGLLRPAWKFCRWLG